MRLLGQYPPGMDPSRPWFEEEVEIRQDSRLFRQMVARRRSPHTGRHHAFYRLEGPDWVNVIAFTPPEQGGELLVVEQFRHGIDAVSLEIPGGSCDPAEEPMEAARRELREETGFVSSRWIPLGHCRPNPAVLTNRCHTFLALDCAYEGEPVMDSAEELSVWACSWDAWSAKLASGEIHHALVLAAFLKLGYWEGWAELEGRILGR